MFGKQTPPFGMRSKAALTPSVGLLFGIVGLGFWLAFTQTAHHLAVGRTGRLLSPFVVPVAVA